jgi:cytochrome b561
VLHWLIAIGLFALIYLGLEQAGMEPGDEKSNMRFIHASIATVLLILMTIRIVWRFLNDTPAHPDNTTTMQRLLSTLVHWGLYITVFAQLLGGAMMSGTAGRGGRGLPLFGLTSIPLPIAKDEAGHEFWEEFHETAWIPVAVLIGVHILGSLYNHFGLKNDVLRRMTHGVK